MSFRGKKEFGRTIPESEKGYVYAGENINLKNKIQSEWQEKKEKKKKTMKTNKF